MRCVSIPFVCTPFDLFLSILIIRISVCVSRERKAMNILFIVFMHVPLARQL